jgi:phosphotriesterase-related protein
MITRRALLAAPLALRAAPVQDSVLVHEHVLVDFGGVVNPGKYDPDEVFRLARPKLEEVNKLGCRRMLECTPTFLGRDPKLLARLAQATGIDIWTNTGIYGAADRKAVPAFARQESAEQLARRFIAEFRNGVDNVRPRFIKTAVQNSPLDDLNRKLVRATTIASHETGLTIASHTGNDVAAVQQLEILAAEKVNPSKFV